jgi:hypothetical protein
MLPIKPVGVVVAHNHPVGSTVFRRTPARGCGALSLEQMQEIGRVHLFQTCAVPSAGLRILTPRRQDLSQLRGESSGVVLIENAVTRNAHP